MAARKEEIFIEENLQPGSVFDFGCGDGRLTRRVAKTHSTTAIDLFEPTSTEGFQFIKADFLSFTIIKEYDNVYAASSIEHVGLGFRDSGYYDPEADRKIAKKLSNITRNGGLLILTVPLGNNELFVYNDDGHAGHFGEVNNPTCGFRTYNLDGLLSMFEDFELVKAKAYLKETDRPDFSNENPNTWSEMSVDDYNKIQRNGASLCVVLRKKWQ